ncbi:MAG TPA: F0F1 ATP synthase subunit B [Opitutaceae bacterium]|nr:F0F1 ATP synthase subunit B [Opitutaceae bacterium]
MLSSSLIVAAASGLTKITDDFGISVPLILAQILSFSIVAIVLWKFAFKPVMTTLDERQGKIESGLQYAEQMKAQLATTQQQTEAALKEAQQKAQAIIVEAQKAAKTLADKQQQDAVEQAAALIAKAQSAIELEKKKMLAEARGEIARLVVATTQRVLAKELSEADRGRFNDAATRELTSV